MKKFSVFLVIIIGILVAIGLFNNQSSSNQQDESKINIVTTIYPLAHFAEQVGGEFVSVTNLVPAGADTHNYSPRPQDIELAQNADLFFYIGEGLDGFSDRIIENASDSITIVKMTDFVDLKEGAHSHDHETEDHEDEHSDEDHKEKMSFDPHIWLDLENASIMVREIANALAEQQPDSKQIFLAEANRYDADLQNLDTRYNMDLQNCKHNHAVVSHDAFGYMAQAYGFELIPLAGLNPESESSAGELSDIILEMKEDEIKYIFTESLANTQLTQTVANETGAELIELNPLESLSQEQLDNGATYISVMRANLESLKTGLECS